MKAALICIAKRENRYIREWCEYHKRIGFDDIFIYDNNEGDERIRDVVGDLPYVRIDERYRNKRQVNVEIQLKCYNEWYAAHRGEYTHFAFFDVDEYLNISPEYKNLQDFIAHKFGIADGMKIFWKCHGDNGHLRYEDKPLHERFPEISEPKDSRYFYKMIFSTKREDFKMINVHYSTPLTHIVDVNGCRIKYSQTTYDRKAIYGKACIDHYITKSTEEFFMNKRGRKDDAKRLSVNFYYNFNDKTDTKDKLIKDILNGKAQQSPAMAAAVTAKPAQTAAAKPAQASEGTFKYHATDELLNKKNEKIIVSFTSWKKRINDCAHTVELMKRQTLKPDKIILNLSTDEFTNKEKDLPSNLLAMQDSVFEIYWVKENTKPHKKITHTLDRFPNDVIITIDDDIEYPKDFIEHLYSEYIAYDRQIPITSGTWQWDNKIYTHYGCFTLIKKEHVGEYYNDLYKNVVLKYGTNKIPFNDPLLTYAVLLNGRRYKMTPYFNMSAIRMQSIKNKQNPISKIGTTEYTKQMADEHKLIQDYIKRKYGKSYGDLFNAPVVVNITTWVKRDYCLYDMLSNLKKQTRKPDKIILWLSEEEYDKNNLPQTIQKCVNEKLLSDIMWVKKNTYCHKRFECFKYFNDCYNIFIDDDILYKPDFIKELVDGAKKHQDCVTVYSSNSIDYDGVKIIKKAHTKEPSHYNAFCGGICCFPPYILPNDVLTENIGLRDVYVKKCDESWLRPFLIRHDIKVNSLYDWNNSFYPTINNSQKDAVWVENFKTTNGMREKERNFFNAIKITHTEALCKKLWSKIGIDKWELTLPQAANNIKSQIIDKAHKKGFASFNIDEPKTWCEKMQWLQLNDNVELRAKCADKVLLHEYCKEKLGKDICVPILKIYSSPNGIKFNELPNKFVLKCNHGYAMNIICRDKSKLNENECKSKIQQWLNTPFGEKSIEPHYLKINRKCYAETFLENKGQLELTDYKFLCFNGTPKYVQIINGRHEDDFRLNYYDMNFNFVNISRCDIPNNPNRLDAKPSQFELMKEYATKLSADFRFVRVDFYEVDGVVYLGELTFTPATGFIKWTDPTIDRKFGDMIDLSYTPQNNTTPPKTIPNHPTESGAPKTDCAQVPSNATRNTDTQSKPSNDGISICITAYQAQDFIEECLDSVARQTWFKDHDNWEVIVGIDGCEETLHKLESIMSNYKNLRVLMMNSNKGTYITSNTIMSQAKYAWLLRFDSDDIMNDDMVETLMNNRDKGDILLMQCQNFGLNENIRKGTQGVIMIRKNIFQKIGGYQPWRCSADGELLKRTSNIYTQYTIDKILFKRRIHPDSLTQKDGSTKLFNMDGSQNAGVERARRQQYIADLNIMYESDATITAMTNSFKEMTPQYQKNTFIVDKIEHNDFLKCKNKIHILIVNYKQLTNTQHIISDLLIQNAPFDLTIFEQNGDEYSKKYLNKLQKEWFLPNCELNVIFNSVNAPLNHIWNWFYNHTSNKYLAFLNNDIEICNNFISDAECIFSKEEKCGIIIHPTNKKEYTKKDNLEYEKTNGYPILQGWDFIINRDAYTIIPNNLWIWRGDVYLMSNAYINGWEQIYDISSPVLHYTSSTVEKHKNDVQAILNKDVLCWKEMNLKEHVVRDDNKYMCRKFNGIYPIDLTKKVIVSFTTWTKRISNVRGVVEQMMNQTKRPDLIVLNLSSEEFNGCENLLKDVIELEKERPTFKINMVNGENTKVWKKWIPIIDKYNNDLIIPIDDDIVYPNDFIEKLYNKWLENPYNPISGDLVKLGNYLQAHCGAGSLIFRQAFGIYINDYKKLMNELCASDVFYTFAAHMNGYSYIEEGMNVLKFERHDETEPYSQSKRKQVNKQPHLWDFDFLNNYYQSQTL